MRRTCVRPHNTPHTPTLSFAAPICSIVITPLLPLPLRLPRWLPPDLPDIFPPISFAFDTFSFRSRGADRARPARDCPRHSESQAQRHESSPDAGVAWRSCEPPVSSICMD
ncbi:hypothetical protein NL676_037853 [Syzygium grande]|nr:hypothetical protein NL676_037853 [Syzygium grande]